MAAGHLFALNDALTSRVVGSLDLQGVEWSYESKETLQHGRYGPMRRFTCPDGTPRQFSAHSKLRSSNQRIYFITVVEHRRAFVGYVGKHLPTVKHRH